MNIKNMVVLTTAVLTLSSTAYAETMSNTGTPQTGKYTPGGRAPQAGSSTVPSSAPDQNQGSSDWYYDKDSYTWKQKSQ